jgi:NADH-quinone oxidoreductase subunit N
LKSLLKLYMLFDLKLSALMPEAFLLGIALFVQILNLFTRLAARSLSMISILLLFSLILFIYYVYPCDMHLGSGCLGYLPHTHKIQICLLGFCIACNIFFIISQKIRLEEFPPEYISLMLFSALGGFIATSAQDFLTLFMAIELQALISYILSSMAVRSSLSSEAGLKYFCLGAISSCVMLFGISLMYGFAGSISYYKISLGSVCSFAMVLILTGLLFKLGASPFHMWLPDVYQGSPIFAVNVFMTINKLTVLISIIRLRCLHDVFFTVAAVSSLLVGALGALKQVNFKRFLGYSSIFNVGYILICLVTKDYKLSVIYLLIYTLNVFMIFSILASLGIEIDTLQILDLEGLALRAKFQSILLAICLLSLMGFPPMLGFVAKYYVLYQTVATGNYYLAVFASSMTLLPAYYYLRIIKLMFLEQATTIPLPAKLSSYGALCNVLNVIGVLIVSFGWVVAL